MTVRNVPAVQLVAILRPLLPPPAALVAFPATNSVVIFDRFANLRRIEGLIKAPDSTPLSKSQTRRRRTGRTRRPITEHVVAGAGFATFAALAPMPQSVRVK